MVDKVGIDAGGSLIKLAYIENSHLHLKKLPVSDIDELLQWLQILSPKKLFITGGKGGYIKQKMSILTEQVEEFTAVINGTNLLLHQEKMNHSSYILVNIGTGTSFFHVTDNSFSRLFGSGIGGGTFIGLGKLLADSQHFQELVSLANRGNYQNVDLLVKDIYVHEVPPLLGELTAANFGKADYTHSTEDKMASVVQLIGETLILLASQAMQITGCHTIVFIGSTVSNNPPLINTINKFQEMLQFQSVFLDRGAFAGAIGALYHDGIK